MSGRASAARYARALLDVAVAEADPSAIGEQLASLASLVSSHAQLRDVLGNPSVPAAAKARVVNELASRLSLAGPLGKLLGMLGERDRLGLLPDLNEVYQERLREHQHVLQAEVTTAAPLDAARVEVLRERLQAATGHQVILSTKVDPGLIGGLVARVGGTVYDGSVSSRLVKMRERLLHGR